MTEPSGVSRCYEVSHLAGRGRMAAKWFVRLATETESFYVGELDPKDGGVRLTKNSRFAENDFAFRLADRVMRAVCNGRTAAMEQHGYTLRSGTPNDRHEETPTTPPAGVHIAPERNAKAVGRVVMLQYDMKPKETEP